MPAPYAQATRINAPASVVGDYPSLEGAITQPLVDSGDVTADVEAADPLEACEPIDAIDGFALILRGNCDFTVKITNAVNAGASGVIVYTQAGNPKVIMGGAATPETQSVPGVMIDNELGVALLAEIENSVTVNATLSPTTFLEESMTGNITADFSSRGPYSTEPSWIKLDVTAPGVQILAGATPEPADGSPGDFFQYLSGTSMSTPHVAGIGALLREAHPDWSPAAIKSALMTTGRINVKKEGGVSRATPFDFGAGHIVPNLASIRAWSTNTTPSASLPRPAARARRSCSRMTATSSPTHTAIRSTRLTSTWRRSASTGCSGRTWCTAR